MTLWGPLRSASVQFTSQAVKQYNTFNGTPVKGSEQTLCSFSVSISRKVTGESF